MIVDPRSIGLYNVITLLLLGGVAKFLINLYRARVKIFRLKSQGLGRTISFTAVRRTGSPRKTCRRGRNGTSSQPGETSIRKPWNEQKSSVSVGRWRCCFVKTISKTDVQDQTIIQWPESASDIPQSWRTIISHCGDIDPNKRISLCQLTDFWERARDEL